MQNREKKSKPVLAWSILAVVLLVVLDQVTKYLAIVKLKGQESYSIIEGVFQLSYLENQSAAFSFDPISLLHKIFHIAYFDANPDAFLMCKMVFFTVLTIVVLIFLAIIYYRIPWNKHFLPMNLIFIGFFSGAIGNLIDRMTHNYVVDFFDFILINFPIFNVADIYVTVSAFALIIVIFFIYKEVDFELIFPSKKKKSE